ncbi:MAG: NFACT RNA binding domain-containing protein [Lachnospiraceae bacterium]|nr:NFACT RNA binding domain-containing protein [Lachnospiraceae bacterium]
MAFDGFTLAAVTDQLSSALIGGTVSKIAMPEKDELLISIRNNSTNYRLLISAGASLPLIYLTEANKPSPLTAPSFCMLLRKYLSGSKITDICQEGLERIVTISFEHINELGDLSEKKIVFELMGKYSNIIFVNENGIIIDSIKRVPSSVSSVREVLPGRKYAFSNELYKIQPVLVDRKQLDNIVSEVPSAEIYKALYGRIAGMSPLMAQELCTRAGISYDIPANGLSVSDLDSLYLQLHLLVTSAVNKEFKPTIIYHNDIPVEFSAFESVQYRSAGYTQKHFDSISRLLEEYYASKELYSRIRQKSSDIRKTVVSLLERASKKYDLQKKQLKDCEHKDNYKVYGDLLNTYGYALKGGEKSFICRNYYDDNNEITIPLDPNKNSSENAKRYYEKYAKLRRTEAALSVEILNTVNTIDHLAGILQSIETSASENDINQIRDELIEFGYLNGKSKDKKKAIKSEPMHFVSSDGFDIYVGKNNYQNEEVTFRIASSNDLWFHAKKVPGSHVIVKCNASVSDMPDRVFREAASLAAYYSQSRTNSKVEVDYTQRKNLRKTPGGPPGYVVYNTNYSITAEPKSEI